MQLATKATGGHPASVAKFLGWVDAIERRAAAERAEFPFSEVSLALARGLAFNRRAHDALYFYRRANEMAPWNGMAIISRSYARARSSSRPS